MIFPDVWSWASHIAFLEVFFPMKSERGARRIKRNSTCEGTGFIYCKRSINDYCYLETWLSPGR